MQPISPLGAPAASAAAAMTRAASRVQRAAAGWGEITMASRAFTAIMTLKKAVEVGLVLGTRAATTPMGRATLNRRRASSRSMTPTVATSFRVSQSRLEQSWFFRVLWAATP